MGARKRLSSWSFRPVKQWASGEQKNRSFILERTTKPCVTLMASTSFHTHPSGTSERVSEFKQRRPFHTSNPLQLSQNIDPNSGPRTNFSRPDSFFWTGFMIGTSAALAILFLSTTSLPFLFQYGLLDASLQERLGFGLFAAGAGDGRWSLPVVIGDISDPPSISEDAVARQQDAKRKEGEIGEGKPSTVHTSQVSVDAAEEDTTGHATWSNHEDAHATSYWSWRRASSESSDDASGGSGDWLGWLTGRGGKPATPEAGTVPSVITASVSTLDIDVEPSSGGKSRPSRAVMGSFIADAVEIVMDSVVNITIETESSRTFRKRSLVSSGSGFFIDEDGTILTNAHVVADTNDDSKLTITTSDGRVYDGQVHSLDVLSDLAVVKILRDPREPHEAWKPVKFGSSKDMRPGDWVMAIGSPFGLQNTVTAGIVSSRRRKSAEIGGRDSRVEYIQTDCVIHSGSSGGPLINLDGEVVGFRMVSLSPQVWQQLRSKGPDEFLPKVQTGVLITSVFPDSPAGEAGCEEGDVITKVNGNPISTTSEIYQVIGLRVGKPIKLNLKRNVPVDMDWDGRARGCEAVDVVVTVHVEELDPAMQGAKTSLLFRIIASFLSNGFGTLPNHCAIMASSHNTLSQVRRLMASLFQIDLDQAAKSNAFCFVHYPDPSSSGYYFGPETGVGRLHPLLKSDSNLDPIRSVVRAAVSAGITSFAVYYDSHVLGGSFGAVEGDAMQRVFGSLGARELSLLGGRPRPTSVSSRPFRHISSDAVHHTVSSKHSIGSLPPPYQEFYTKEVGKHLTLAPHAKSLTEYTARPCEAKDDISFADLADLLCHELRNPLNGILGCIEVLKETFAKRKALLTSESSASRIPHDQIETFLQGRHYGSSMYPMASQKDLLRLLDATCFPPQTPPPESCTSEMQVDTTFPDCLHSALVSPPYSSSMSPEPTASSAIKRKICDEESGKMSMDSSIRAKLLSQLQAEEEALSAIELCASHATLATDEALELSKLQGPSSIGSRTKTSWFAPVEAPVEVDLGLLICDAVGVFSQIEGGSGVNPDWFQAVNDSASPVSGDIKSMRLTARCHPDPLKRALVSLVSNALVEPKGDSDVREEVRVVFVGLGHISDHKHNRSIFAVECFNAVVVTRKANDSTHREDEAACQTIAEQLGWCHSSLVMGSWTVRPGNSVKKYEGTRIGLLVTKRQVELMGGQMFVDIGRSGCTTFSILFNRCEQLPKSSITDEHAVDSLEPLSVAFDSRCVAAATTAGNSGDFSRKQVKDLREKTFGLEGGSLFKKTRVEGYGRARQLSVGQAVTGIAMPISPSTDSVRRALIVEDNQINQRLLQRLLLQIGIESTIVNDGVECLEILSRDGTFTYDIVFMDVILPRLDGYTTTSEIRRLEQERGYKDHNLQTFEAEPPVSPVSNDSMGVDRTKRRIRIVGVSSNARGEQIQAGLACGMDEYIVKPWKKEDIYRVCGHHGSPNRRPTEFTGHGVRGVAPSAV
ncbi:hypothetical protein HDU67_007229 [Dinochytrium kinnereticum]|nr:hypothetical protein HDU67_007229 [Dinochytrium kinnereticum]